MGVVIWFSIYPSTGDNIMNPYSVYMIAGGPQTILSLMIIVVTLGVMIRKNRKHGDHRFQDARRKVSGSLTRDVRQNDE